MAPLGLEPAFSFGLLYLESRGKSVIRISSLESQTGNACHRPLYLYWSSHLKTHLCSFLSKTAKGTKCPLCRLMTSQEQLQTHTIWRGAKCACCSRWLSPQGRAHLLGYYFQAGNWPPVDALCEGGVYLIFICMWLGRHHLSRWYLSQGCPSLLTKESYEEIL